MSASEEQRRGIVQALGMGIRAAKDQNKELLGNQYGDLVVLVEAAKRVHQTGKDALVDAAMAAVAGSLPPVAAAHAQRVAQKQLVPELDRVIVGNYRKNLLIVVELAEQYVNQDSQIHGQDGADVAA